MSCASSVAEGASLDMTEVRTEGDCFPLRLVSPSSPLVRVRVRVRVRFRVRVRVRVRVR